MVQHLRRPAVAWVALVAVTAALVIVALSRGSAAQGSASRTFVIPHVLEKLGKVSATQYTFDTTIYATYATGIITDTAASPGATVDLYLFSDSGDPMLSKTRTPVCDPCTNTLGSTTRKVKFSLDDLFVDAGGFVNKKTVLGYGVIVVGGQDPDGVNLQGFVVNSHTSPFDLSVFGFTPQPLLAADLAAG